MTEAPACAICGSPSGPICDACRANAEHAQAHDLFLTETEEVALGMRPLPVPAAPVNIESRRRPRAAPATADAPAPDAPPPPDAHCLVDGGRARALADADSLLGRQPHVYQRNGMLVQIAKLRDMKARRHDDSLIKRDPESLQLHPMTADHVMNVAAREAWQKFDRRLNGWRPADFPQSYARGVVAAMEWAGVRPLTGIIGAPTLDAQMNVIDTPGYDAGTGLLLVSSTTFDRVPAEPTQEDARAALAILRQPFDEFPWVRRDDDPKGATTAESAHLAAMLTAGVRHLLDKAPAFGYDAPQRGTGKTLLADAVGKIWHGIEPAHANYAKGDDEFRKLMAACLVAGDPIILVDNIDRPMRSPELCNALTTTRYSDRKLGYTERYVLDARVVWMLTGNNLVLVGDLVRRAVMSRIDAEQERPEARSFTNPNLLHYIQQRRRQLVPAALTIVKAFALANPPTQATEPFGSFEGWSRMVREALIWLDMPDPCATTKHLAEEESERRTLASILTAWRDAYGGQARSAVQVMADATGAMGRGMDGEDQLTPPLQREALREALLSACSDQRQMTGRWLGYYLRRWQDVVASGCRVRRAGEGHNNVTLWRVENLDEDDGLWR